jgi:hypothetical protein
MRDYLRDCNTLGVTEEEFRTIWCIRCIQQECSRSHQGKSRFEARTATWAERLFTNVPRMRESDPRYPRLAAQEFVPVESWKGTSVQVPASWDPPAEAARPPAPAPATLPTGFVASRVPHQSGRMLGDVQIVQPGARVRLGGAKEAGGGGSSGVG